MYCKMRMLLCAVEPDITVTEGTTCPTSSKLAGYCLKEATAAVNMIEATAMVSEDSFETTAIMTVRCVLLMSIFATANLRFYILLLIY